MGLPSHVHDHVDDDDSFEEDAMEWYEEIRRELKWDGDDQQIQDMINKGMVLEFDYEWIGAPYDDSLRRLYEVCVTITVVTGYMTCQ